jgi:ATP-dependent Clp protease ATP-binding subunit ClpB
MASMTLLDPGRLGSKTLKLSDDLSRLVIGQDEAAKEIVGIYQTFLAGMSPTGRPFGTLLFLGPTGTGKTRMVEALAQSLVGTPKGIIKIDCAEFQHSHEIAKLVG